MVVTFYIPITPLSGHTSMRWFEASPRRAAPKGQPSSLAQHRVKKRCLRHHFALLSSFVAHRRSGFAIATRSSSVPSTK